MAWGGLFFSADDQNVHLMWAKQAQGGSLFIRDLFTTEGLVSGEKPLFFNLFALGVGFASRLTGLDLMVIYHAARIAFAALFVHQFHRLLVATTNGAPEREDARLGALALATLSTGGGFVLVLFPDLIGKIVFLDHPVMGFVTVPEGFALLSALIYPLNIAGFALLCFLLRALIENRHPFKAFLAAMVLSNIHTYDALPLLLTCLLGLGWSVLRRENAKEALRVGGAIFLGALLPVIYQALVFRGSEEFRVKALTPTSPPVIWAIFSSFAPLLILAVLGWRARWVAGTHKWLWLYAWSILAMMYLPKSPGLLWEALFVNHENQQMVANIYFFSFARKMIEGFQIPLLVFAGAGLAALPLRKFLAPLAIAVMMVSPLMFWAWTMENAVENNQARVQRFWMPPYSLSSADAGALLALQKEPDKNQAVLCLPLIGSYVPRATGLFTFTGHWAETLHIARKNSQTRRFYQGQMTPAEAREFLKSNRIGFIIESPFERDIAPNPSFARALGLQGIYTANTPGRGETIVFRVN